MPQEIIIVVEAEKSATRIEAECLREPILITLISSRDEPIENVIKEGDTYRINFGIEKKKKFK